MRDLKKAIRKRKEKSTQRGFAKKLKVSEAFISQIVTGKRKCPKRLKAKFESILKNF